MTESLQNAFDTASQLPDSEQDAIAAWLIAELEADRRWDESFSNSQDKLAFLAKDALAEHARGGTKSWGEK
jgi:hypothetical protein